MAAGWISVHVRQGKIVGVREVLIYTVAKKMLDLNNLTPIQARLLAERGNRIRQNQPIVDLTAMLGSL
ncbi:MAG: hypothetical protein WAK31_06755 [Chthoniobacterales bacterium]